ncbi:MAG: MFS transporter, partial [Clostridia bacterium]|nr:MFS transporter [Clostridia bacterium]
MPLLFIILSKSYNISLAQITLLVTVNFATQLTTDCLSVLFVDRVGYRGCMVVAHILAGTGFVGLAVLPEILSNPYVGLLISVLLYSVAGGLFEVLASPILEACPFDNKKAAMSLLHSMFSFGTVGLILISTLFFAIAGKENWKYLAAIVAIVPYLNAIYFMFVPIRKTVEDSEKMPLSELLRDRFFWLFILIMICSGAAEQGMCQWASAFAESTLGISKAMGDILGPCMFAILMGLARVLYPKVSHKISLTTCMIFCGVLCIMSYLMAVFSPFKFMALAGCGLCGFATGIMWPGTVSLAAEKCPAGGTALFAGLALAGDIGCTSGPSVIGFVSAMFG